MWLARFWNANFPPEYKPLQKKIPSKRAFKNYKSRGLFSEFYGISFGILTTNLYLYCWCAYWRSGGHRGRGHMSSSDILKISQGCLSSWYTSVSFTQRQTVSGCSRLKIISFFLFLFLNDNIYETNQLLVFPWWSIYRVIALVFPREVIKFIKTNASTASILR